MHPSDLARLSIDLQRIKEVQGSNAKKELATGWTSPAHKELLDLIGNTSRQWYITWGSVLEAAPVNDGVEWDDLWHEAEARLCTPTVTAGRVRQLIIGGAPVNLLKAIVDKTPDCGLSVKEFLKARGEMKPFAISLAADWCDMSNDKRDALLATKKYATTPKMDGLRCFVVLIPGEYAVLSRSMKPLKNQSKTLEALKVMFEGYPCCIDGEILADNWNDTVTAAKSSSGGNIKARLHVFDLVTAAEYKGGIFAMPKARRLAELDKRMTWGGMFVKVPFEPVFDRNEALHYLKEHLAQGFEGSVLHDMTAVYRPNPNKSENRSLALIKIKEWKSAEFRVVGFMAGTGKHQGRLGALIVEGEVEGRKIRCEVGTGFTDSLREEIWANQKGWTNAICETKFFEVTKDSLRFPSFLRRRTDLE